MSEIHAGPLPQAAPDGEHHVGPLPRATRFGNATRGIATWWRQHRDGRRAAKAAAAVAPAELRAGPLPQADPSDEHHVGPLPQAAHTATPRAKKSWREKRWERRRRRRFTEEVLGWVLVPVILLSGFWAMKAGLNAMGTNFTDLIKGIKTAFAASGKV
ncbi:hypothetical protein [uncultured Enterovirga sp.]|uniref:hypothetical protein n=1 Tax=uncultured Enterovirga sp. TaxID=2026352 RepID=UPI0035CBC2A1